jgi:hypothetical protein
MLAVARALSGNVKLLLLDEPFEGPCSHRGARVVQGLRPAPRAHIDRDRGAQPGSVAGPGLPLFALERGTVFHQEPAAEFLNDLDYRMQILWL